jgi:glycosyltransferase involved in cell wall biosynthesis
VACVIVVNNGSMDHTAEIAKRAGALVIDEPTPGYGRACRAGIHAVRRLKRKGFSQRASFVANVQSFDDIRYVAFLDGDYSDFPEQLPTLVAPIHHDQADLVLGSRALGNRERGAMPPQAVFGNWLACNLIRWIWGHRFSDLGPFRVIRLDRLNQLNLKDKTFGWTVEMQIKAVRNRIRILEMPIPYRCRIGASKISGTLSGTMRAGYKILATIAKYAIMPN